MPGKTKERVNITISRQHYSVLSLMKQSIEKVKGVAYTWDEFIDFLIMTPNLTELTQTIKTNSSEIEEPTGVRK